MTPAANQDGHGPVSRPIPQRGASRRSSLDWAREAGIAQTVIRELAQRVQKKHRDRRRRRLAASSTAVALFLVVGAWWRFGPERIARPNVSSRAFVAMPARQQLPDRSVIELNEGARVKVDYSGALRRVVLECGEAHFQVVKNVSRPFIVSAGGVDVRAVGTGFSVQLGGLAVEVLVTEGRVEVEKTAGKATVGNVSPTQVVPQILAALDAGNRVVVKLDSLSTAVPPTPVLAVSAAELTDRLSWRVPRLEFSGTPLSDALDLFNRHSAVHLVLADPELGRLKLSGMVRADNTDTLLQLLHSELDLTDERGTDREIVLRRASAAKSP